MASKIVSPKPVKMTVNASVAQEIFEGEAFEQLERTSSVVISNEMVNSFIKREGSSSSNRSASECSIEDEIMSLRGSCSSVSFPNRTSNPLAVSLDQYDY
mmetsp:Transcript_124556/g.175710  ORF Transcript_124556/g.175710 Transcript_124556/m.175710 type:complete len:100 (+) Transcript_124556:120-419(+)